MQLPTKEEMRARFWELKGAIDAREAVIAAKHAELEPIKVKADAIRAEIMALSAGVIEGMSMYDAKMDLATLARALGNVGAAPEG